VDYWQVVLLAVGSSWLCHQWQQQLGGLLFAAVSWFALIFI
jgi:hypothetical protein